MVVGAVDKPSNSCKMQHRIIFKKDIFSVGTLVIYADVAVNFTANLFDFCGKFYIVYVDLAA